LGYRGGYSLEVFNDDYWQIDPSMVARRARESATWINEDVLKRAAPAPWAVPSRRPPRGTTSP
jgi:hypothetical protein